MATDTIDIKEDLQEAYIDKILENNKPHSIRSFCKENNISESEFYDLYSNFEALEKDIWQSFVKITLESLEQDEDYINYSTREKGLAFFYTLIESLKMQRSWILFHFNDCSNIISLTKFKELSSGLNIYWSQKKLKLCTLVHFAISF